MRSTLRFLLVLSIASTAASATQSPSLSVSPASLSFAAQPIGSASAQKTVTVTNNGKVAVSITSITVSGADASDFAQTNTCPASPTTLAAGHYCTIKVTFTPAASGSRTASLVIKDNATGSPQSEALSGSGTSVVGLSPAALNFASQATGGASSPQQVTLSNSGSTALTISEIEVEGADSSDFAQSSTCGTALAAKSSCSISITFVPTAGGARTAMLEIVDISGTQTATLNGTGLAPTATMSTSTLQFGSQDVNSGSASQSVTLTNGGSASLSITGIAVNGSDPADFSQSSNCPISPASLAIQATCTISVIFKPSAAGTRSAMLCVSDYVQGSPQVVSLFGNGAGQIAIAVSPITAMLQTGVIQPFSASVSNTTNTSVTWSVNGIQAGNATVGTIDVNGNYTAPSAVPIPATVTIAATSQADGVTTASASATIITRSLIVRWTFGQSPIVQPPDGLVQAKNGALYGTNFWYGAAGSLYSMSPAGTSAPSLLYSFTSQNTGWPPVSLMQGVNGDIYSMTWNGGENGNGAVLDYNGTSSPAILHSFNSHFQLFAVGAYPTAPAMVQDDAGNLYGYGDGGIFQLSPPGTFTSYTMLCTLGSGDGQYPSRLLVGIDGNLYGTTTDGGPNVDGEVFKCTQQGNLTVLHTFAGLDGKGPVTLIQTSDSTLWGVTSSGGPTGDGELFKIQSSDSFVNSIVFYDVYSFPASVGTPDALIAGSDGNFYGTTMQGGASSAGTIFEVSPVGILSVLQSFNGGSQGGPPYGLIQGQDGTFYGLAMTSESQWGEVFSFGLPSGGSGTPALSLSNYSFAFGNQATGTTSVGQFLTIDNIGTANLIFTDISITGANAGDFALQSETCPMSPQTLAPSSLCNMSVSFTPSASGSRSAAISIVDNAGGSPQLIPLSGTGEGTSTGTGSGGSSSSPIANVSPAALGFGTQTVGVTSGALAGTVSNTGSADLTISNISLTGSNATDFVETSNCPIAPAMLGVNGTCAISITFTPGGAGLRSAAIAVTDNAGASPQVLTLSGTGLAGSLNPPPTVFLEVASASGSLTSTSSGSVELAWSSSATSGCVLSASTPSATPISGLPAAVPCSTTSGYAVTLPYNSSLTLAQIYTLTLTAPNPGGTPGAQSVTVYTLPSVTYGNGTPFSSNNAANAGGILKCEIPEGCGINYALSENPTAEDDGLSLLLTAGIGFIGSVTGDQDGLSAAYPPSAVSIPLGYTDYLAVQPAASVVSIQACTADIGAAGSDFTYQVNDSAGNTWPANGQPSISTTNYCGNILTAPFNEVVTTAFTAFQNAATLTQDSLTLFQNSQTSVKNDASAVADVDQIILDLQSDSGALGPISAAVQLFSIPSWNAMVSAAAGYTVTTTSGGYVVVLGIGGAGQVVISASHITVQGIAAQVAGGPGSLLNVATN